MNGWISVKERLPEKDVPWVAVFDGKEVLYADWDSDEGFMDPDFPDHGWRIPYNGVTHWQPLPPPPEVTE